MSENMGQNRSHSTKPALSAHLAQKMFRMSTKKKKTKRRHTGIYSQKFQEVDGWGNTVLVDSCTVLCIE